MYESIRRVLSRPKADAWVVFLSTLLVLPSLFSGLAADDFIHELELRPDNPLVGFRESPLDLFRFASPDVNQSLVNDGVFPWWVDLKVRFAFFRPLSSATHYFDHLVLPGNAVFMHVHTVLWALLAVLAARRLYRGIMGPGFVATLALCLYALDDARGSPVAWVANRNELVACAISVWAIVFYHEGRHGRQSAKWLAPLMLGLGMLAGEGSIAVTAYLFAYALFLDAGTLKERLLRLVPFAGVVVVWAALYRGLGYGISRSGLYFDPLRDPVEFLGALPARFSMLWLAQLGGPWSEGWNAYPVMFPGLQYVVAAMAVVVIAGTAYLFAPLVRENKVARFWAVGALLGTLPACGAFPADRLLPWIGIGAFGLTAEFFARFLEAPNEPGVRGLVSRGGAFAIVAAHLVMGPFLLPFRAMGIAQVRATLDRAIDTVPSDPSITKRVVIYVNPCADPFASYVPMTRAALGIPRPKTQRWLATGATAVHLSRVDERTLRVRPEGGYMILPSEQLFRNTQTHPFVVGEVISTEELQVTISAVTADGRPAEVLARLDKPLEDPAYLWLSWKGAGYAPFTPPPVGTDVVAPHADLVTVAYGPNSPVTRWLRGEAKD